MLHLADRAVGLGAHAFLVAFCEVAMDLYPDLDWEDVEPKLACSWERYLGDGIRQWSEVREFARERWETNRC